MAGLANAEGLDAYAQFGQLDMAFHDQIAVSADNALLLQALAGLHAHVHLFRLVREPRVTRTVLDEHEALVAAIKARDPAAAEQAMRAHIERSHARFAAA
jgi:DNA-binding GntR family transcriptional regulator